MSESKKHVNVVLPERLNDAVEDRLDYGDSKSEYVREAIRQRLDDDS